MNTVDMTQSTVAVIPARGGSKVIPRKNLAPLNGRPLISYTICAARQSRLVQRVVVSTEDPEIKAAAHEYGAEVIDRPLELAGDDCPTLPVLKHALNQLEHNGSGKFDIVVVLQPTVPYRSVDDIDRAIEMLISKNADAVVGVVRSKVPREWLFKLENGRIEFFQKPDFGRARRQEGEECYRLNGSIYVYRASTIIGSDQYAWGDNTYGYVMDNYHSVDIDEPFDLAVAQMLLHASPNPSV